MKKKQIAIKKPTNRQQTQSKTISQWPAGFFDFEPIDDIPDFKSYRKDLKKYKHKDPLANNSLMGVENDVQLAGELEQHKGS